MEVLFALKLKLLNAPVTKARFTRNFVEHMPFRIKISNLH